MEITMKALVRRINRQAFAAKFGRGTYPTYQHVEVIRAFSKNGILVICTRTRRMVVGRLEAAVNLITL